MVDPEAIKRHFKDRKLQALTGLKRAETSHIISY